MTNEQVITRIKHNSMYKDDRETADYIIKALEQEEYYKDLAQSYERTIAKLTQAIAERQSSGDCVSREQAIVQLSIDLSEIELPRIKDSLDELPPVTPTHGTCKDCKYAEIHNGKMSEHCSVKCEPFCRKFLRFTSGEDFFCSDFDKRGNKDDSI